MKAVILNGSPKKGQGSTAVIVQTIEELMGRDAAVFQAVDFMRQSDAENRAKTEQILQADALLIVTPLYVDALPMPLIKALQGLERAASAMATIPKVYAVCQCGFYEASHNELALEMIRHFCNRSGLSWQFGVGIGAGVLLGRSKNIKKGQTKKIFEALNTLCDAVKSGAEDTRANIYVVPAMPRFLYQFGGNVDWRQQARASGASGQLKATPSDDR